MIYLDNGATTFPKPECVYDAVDRFNRTAAVNAGRGAYRAAREATEMIRRVKDRLISLADAREQAEVVLTPSVTIALNQIIWGQNWKGGMNVYISPYEHNAVSRPLELVRRRERVNVRLLPLKEDLSVDLDETARMFRENPPDFVCCTAISNVTGYVLPAEEVLGMAKDYGAFTVLDAAQAMGLLRIRFARMHADCIAFAGHKTLYAPFGIAGFLIRSGADLREFITGGNGIRSTCLDMPSYMPEKMESASMDTPAIAGLDASLEWLKHHDTWKTEAELTGYLLPRLAEIPGVTVYPAPGGPERQAGVISFNVEGFRANEVAAILDREAGICVRAGHHCAAYIHDFLGDEKYDGTSRVSLGAFSTKKDLDVLLKTLRSIDRAQLKGIDAGILRGNC